MDSVTQFLLGASVGGAVLGPRLGAKALLLGGIVGTLPDLDGFLPAANALDAMTEHRGPSHSLIVQSAAAPVIAFALTRLMPSLREAFKPVLLAVWLCLVTHALLDSLTTYGTQLFWPLPAGPPAALPAVFIIDPLYSLTLLAGLIWFLVRRHAHTGGVRAVRLCLALTGAYLALGLAGQVTVSAQARAHPEFQDKRLLVQPAPFSLYFWQVLGVAKDSYATAMTTILPGCSLVDIRRHPRLAAPPAESLRTPSVARLEWFTDGFYTYRVDGERLRIVDLRLGQHRGYVFTFDIGERNGGSYESTPPVRLPRNVESGEALSRIGTAFARVLDAC